MNSNSPVVPAMRGAVFKAVPPQNWTPGDILAASTKRPASLARFGPWSARQPTFTSGQMAGLSTSLDSVDDTSSASSDASLETDIEDGNPAALIGLALLALFVFSEL